MTFNWGRYTFCNIVCFFLNTVIIGAVGWIVDLEFIPTWATANLMSMVINAFYSVEHNTE